MNATRKPKPEPVVVDGLDLTKLAAALRRMRAAYHDAYGHLSIVGGGHLDAMVTGQIAYLTRFTNTVAADLEATAERRGYPGRDVPGDDAAPGGAPAADVLAADFNRLLC